jgi:hypothetical protein
LRIARIAEDGSRRSSEARRTPAAVGNSGALGESRSAGMEYGDREGDARAASRQPRSDVSHEMYDDEAVLEFP